MRDRTPLLALPATAYYALIFAAPILLLLVESLRGPQGWTLAGYARFFGDAYSWQLLWTTVRVALATTACCLLIGYPAAFALAQAGGRLQALLIAVLLLPLSLSVIVKAFGWTILLRGNGVINKALMGLGVIDQPMRLIFTETGLLIGIVNIFLPFMILPLFSVLKLIDPRLSEAAATLGAGPLYRLTRVVMPLTLPGVVAGVALVFSMAISAYVIPTLLMGDRFQTMSTAIATSYLFLRDAQRGAVTGVLLLAIAAVVVVGSSVLARRLGGTRA